jgi:primosomal protein N' (replication factor Y)
VTAAVRAADVILDARVGGATAIYTYAWDGVAAEGDAYFVPLAARSVLGFVLSIRSVDPSAFDFDLRPLGEKVEGLSIPSQLMETVRYLAQEYLCPLPVALSVATPPAVAERLVRAWEVCEGASADSLTPLQQETLAALKDSGGVLLERRGKKPASGTAKALKLLKAKGLVRETVRLAPSVPRKGSQQLYHLTPDADRLSDFLVRDARKKPAQALTLMRLQEAEDAHLTSGEIKALAGVTDTTIKSLVEAGLLLPVEDELQGLRTPPEPNAYQRLAIDAIADQVRSRSSKPFLLHGITGSGKTEVYLRCASEALKLGRQVLYLVPEIALATQVIGQLRERFGRRVAVLHSEVPPGERLDTWMKIRSGEAPVVVGARSALFAPLDNVGLIVMDEEHEGSYKQDKSPRYHTKRVALKLAELHRAPLVLGSATPSFESFYEAEQGLLELLPLPQRAADARLPTVHIEDLTEGYRHGRPSILTEELQRRMEETLARGEQVILFLNRRAYSPFLICRDCGHQFKCPHCAVSLAYSRRSGRLRCHHCGYSEKPPAECPACHGIRLNPFGIGTEKVEEAVAAMFPDASVARLDRDVAAKKGALEAVLAGVRSGEIQVLVGTQMVAKGLDFPNVTLVGVVAADVSLNIPDFRASERTFQLLSQVSGRAGRGRSPGHVVIQTFNPQNAAVEAAAKHEYTPFYERLKEERREAQYPPFVRLVNIVISGENLASVGATADAIARALIPLQDLEVLGPADCALERLQGRWRKHVLVKLHGGGVGNMGECIAAVSHDPKVQVVVDVDPYSLT